MGRTKAAIVVLITYIVLAVGISMLTPGKGQSQNPPPTFNVKVSNTPLPVTGSVTSTVNGPVSIANTPLPVTGDVNVANLPTVDARQKGPWTVGISGIPAVDTGLSGAFDTANGYLSNIEGQANKLAFDGSNNLKVALPGTQDVNVVGGTVNARMAPATRGAYAQFYLSPGQSANYPLAGGGINVSTITFYTFDLAPNVYLIGPNGIYINLGTVRSGQVISFPRPIPITRVLADNPSQTGSGGAQVSLVGD